MSIASAGTVSLLQVSGIGDAKDIIELAIRGNLSDMVNYLDECPDEVDVSDEQQKCTALHISSFKGNMRKVELLVRYRADLIVYQVSFLFTSL